MSSSAISVNTSAGQPISITGLASGIETSAIIKALVAAEQVPITHLTTQQEKLQAQQEELRSLQSTLQQLSYAVQEFSLPSLFESTQTATSSDPSLLGVLATPGAAVGGYQVEVTQLANAAQRSFTFASPTAEEAITIDGTEFKIAAGATAKELATKINSSGAADVYAAVEGGETIVLSNRATGETGGEFIKVTSGAALTEKVGTAREGQDAEYAVDGVAGRSASNTLTEAIAGVTLTLTGVTTVSGPVTVDVQPPTASTSAIESRLQAFVKLYNSTVETLQKQLTTKPVAGASNAKEYAIGTVFGDTELMGVVSRMRSAMYEAVAGLPAGMTNPLDIGLGTAVNTSSGSNDSPSAIEGLISLEPAKLASAVAENPEAVQKMLAGWSKNLQAAIAAAAEPGGGLASRIEGDEAQVTQLKSRITTMNEALTEREKSLVATYAALEAALAKNDAELSWLSEQESAKG